MWTTIYAPTCSKDIIGGTQTSSVLTIWLNQWSRTQSKKAVLLSGPPGVGKTLMVSLILKELNYDIVELNASDVRNKQKLNTTVRESTKSGILQFMTPTVQTYSTKRALVLDEIDGLSTGDMGGLAEIITIIKESDIPILCMCNDRQKVTSLIKQCLDLKIVRPMKQLVFQYLQNILLRENISRLRCTPEILMKLIEESSNDIRQCINTLQFWYEHAEITDDESAITVSSGKDISHKYSIFDACSIILKGDSPLDDRFDAFFTDYSIIPMFIQQNYIESFECGSLAYRATTQKTLDYCSIMAGEISDLDLVESKVGNEQNWELLPCVASICIQVGSNCKGSSFPQFPKWLGKNSTRNKNSRNLMSVSAHSLKILKAPSNVIRLDFASYVNYFVTWLILQNEPTEAILRLSQCGFSRNDLFDCIKDILLLSNEEKDLLIIPTKTKSAFTREYNKTRQLSQSLYDEIIDPYKQITRKPTKKATAKKQPVKKTVKNTK